MTKPHILLDEYKALGGMREFYRAMRVVATSTEADSMLIRSHIAYHTGHEAAERAEIKPSRGDSYRIDKTKIVKIIDHYDYRAGVQGFTIDKDQD